MSRSGLDEIEPAFDPLGPRFQAIQATVDPDEPFLDVRQANLDVLKVVDDPVDSLFDARQARLHLLQDRHDDVARFGHDETLHVPGVFSKAAIGR